MRRNESESRGHWSGAKVGAPIRRKAAEFLGGCALNFFGSKSTTSRFGERFRDGQYSLVSFLFAVLLQTVPPPVPSHFNKRDTSPRALRSRRHSVGHLTIFI